MSFLKIIWSEQKTLAEKFFSCETTQLRLIYMESQEFSTDHGKKSSFLTKSIFPEACISYFTNTYFQLVYWLVSKMIVYIM